MHRRLSLPGVLSLGLLLIPTGRAAARDLTFEDRVGAQEAIERLYYTHQIDATRPFVEAVPRSVLETKVRTYLRQSLALEAFWSTRITADMLQKELLRMSAGTRMPERLRELFAALGNDPLLMRECLARPALVGRLARNFYDYGPSFHVQSRREADALAADLTGGRIDPWSDHPGRIVTELARGETCAADFDASLALIPQDVGQAGPVVEERGRFVVRVPLKKSPDEIRFATYAVEKRAYEDWWRQVEGRFDERSVEAAMTAGETPTITAGAGSCADDTWDNGSLDDTPLARNRHTAVWTGSVMIIWGGFARGGRYDPATDTWTPVSTINEPPRSATDNTAVWTGSRMIVWGGNFGTTNLNTGGLYDPVADAWSPTTTNGAPEARFVHTAVWTGDRMIVWGGLNSAGASLATGAAYDPAADAWTPTATLNAPSGRYRHTAVWTGSRMIVWAGAPDGPGGAYDPRTDSWSPVSALNAPGGRFSHTAVWTGDRMIVWGGTSITTSGALNTGGRYDPSTDTWSPTALLNAPTTRSNHTAVWTGSQMVVWGGATSGGSTSVNTGASYDPDADAWTPTTTANAPQARYFHSAVWTGSLMVVWGGWNGGISFNTGGRYDPGTNTWTPTSTGGAPGPRFGHATTWTGSLMLVWGGTDNSGGRYDPALDTWSFTSTLNAPVPRYSGMTAVWTGSVMVVWGGTNSTGTIYYNTGGRYDPVADIWAPTSTVNVPTGRTSHTAVWTGGVMVVWGGYWITGPPAFIRFELNTGGRYDPVADTWSPTTTTGAPAGRQDHASVWTGSQMIVWGGYIPSTPDPYPATGGRYDPVADSWSPTSTTNAPPGRNFHTGIWTGREAIFWGGGANVNTGGRYDPSTDTWTPTSLTNAPPGRSQHGAVWTGKEMIVYGGSQTPGGGRYDPAADTWRSISLVDIPPSYILMSDVWTGTFMVIWGGQPVGGTGGLNTGGRYCACTMATFFQDTDGDGFGNPLVSVQSCVQLPGYVSNSTDCNDSNATIWATPSEVLGDQFADAVTLAWSPPSAPGGTADVYDVLRSTNPADFVGAATCIMTRTAATNAADPATPLPGQVFFYLVRADDACPSGLGSLGTTSSGTARTGRSCP